MFSNHLSSIISLEYAGTECDVILNEHVYLPNNNQLTYGGRQGVPKAHVTCITVTRRWPHIKSRKPSTLVRMKSHFETKYSLKPLPPPPSSNQLQYSLKVTIQDPPNWFLMLSKQPLLRTDILGCSGLQTRSQVNRKSNSKINPCEKQIICNHTLRTK